jgi:protein-tyrosine phosphatase
LIDVNCHALPEGGGESWDEHQAIELLAALAADGVDVAAVTPVVGAGATSATLDGIRDALSRLRAAAERRRIPELIPGAELDLGWALAASDEDLFHASYGRLGRTLLIATPRHGTLPDFDDMVLNLKLRGYGIVLAHPEAGVSYQAEPGRLGRLVREGVLMQIDAASILGEPRSRTRRLAFALLEEESAHVIASGGRPGAPPRLSEAVRVAEEAIGARARWMAVDAPAAVLGGGPLPAAPRAVVAAKGLFRRRAR